MWKVGAAASGVARGPPKRFQGKSKGRGARTYTERMLRVSVPGVVILGLAVGLAGCGAGSPVEPAPARSPEPGFPVAGFVFYDEDGNGSADGSEVVRLPGVSVDVGGQVGATDGRGRFVAEGVPAGTATARLLEASLPPYFVAGTPFDVGVPQAPGTDVPLRASLPIGGNRANTYLTFGDSITEGDGSGDGFGYRFRLETDLTRHLGEALLINDARAGSRTNQAIDRLGPSLQKNRPAYVLILYGTNDWNRPECKDERFPCFTIDSLRTLIGIVRAFDSLPVLGTIIPANPAYVDRDALARNAWVERMNELIRELAIEEGVSLADPHALFVAEPRLESLFSDHVHPNDAGYDLIAAAFFEAITAPRGGS